jgi:hypothetical protein
MSVELAFINQLLTKPNSAEKVTLTAGSTITKGSEITINNDGEAELNAYNIIPDNTISSYFFDYPFNAITSASPIAPYGTDAAVRNFGPNKEYFAFLHQETESSIAKVYLYVLKIDTSTNTISTAGSVLVKSNQANQNDAPSYTTFMITPEEDYILVAFGGRQFVTGNTNYGQELWRINLSASGGLSGSTKIYDTSGSSGVYRYLFIGSNSYYTTNSANLSDRYVYLRSYYSTTFNSVKRISLSGSSTVISTDFNSTVGTGWYAVDDAALSYGQQLHYIATTNKLGYIRYLTSFTNSSYWGQLSITPATGAVPFQVANLIYVDDEPDSNNIVRYVMWDFSKSVTTYQILVDPTGSTAPTLSGQYTTTITDANAFIGGRAGNTERYGNKWAKSGDDVYFAMPNNKFTSTSTDSGPDYQANIMKLTYSSASGGYYTLSHQGLVDARLPSTSDAYAPFMKITTDGTFVATVSSDWDTTDGVNDHKHGLFKVSTTGLSDATYAHRVKCVALEDATAGNTFQALSYAPVVSDSTLVAGTVYDRHIATSNGLLIEKA